MEDFTFRDLLAFPFYLVSLGLLKLAIMIEGDNFNHRTFYSREEDYSEDN